MISYAAVFLIGLGAHAEKLDAPEIKNIDNPIGIVRYEREVEKDIKFYCEHISSIPVYERGYGFNHCGFTLQIEE